MNIKSPTQTDIESLRHLWQEAFSDTDDFLDLFFTYGFSSERCLFIEEADSAAAALYWFDCEYGSKRIAYIYAVATAKIHRGKGLCHKLMEYTHENLKTAGYAGTILVPGSDSLFKFYESMGYKTTCYVHDFTCNADEANINLTQISKDVFASLRRDFLPDNCVIQEKENLDFLSSYAKFYKGEDFIITAHKDKNTLFCTEILGNTSKAPQIVGSLGCKTGHFRTYGDSKPFAMYLPLQEGENIFPSYFGYAFD